METVNFGRSHRPRILRHRGFIQYTEPEFLNVPFISTFHLYVTKWQLLPRIFVTGSLVAVVMFWYFGLNIVICGNLQLLITTYCKYLHSVMIISSPLLERPTCSFRATYADNLDVIAVGRLQKLVKSCMADVRPAVSFEPHEGELCCAFFPGKWCSNTGRLVFFVRCCKCAMSIWTKRELWNCAVTEMPLVDVIDRMPFQINQKN
jgi:hypothetical protein